MGLASISSRSFVSSSGSSGTASNSSCSVIFDLFEVFVGALVSLDFVGPLDRASDERAATSFKAVVRDLEAALELP